MCEQEKEARRTHGRDRHCVSFCSGNLNSYNFLVVLLSCVCLKFMQSMNVVYFLVLNLCFDEPLFILFYSLLLVVWDSVSN